MITTDQKVKLIELRAKGLSYEKISIELNISKPTVLKLKNELQKEIKNAEFTEIQILVDQIEISSKEKLEVISKKLKEIYSEIETKEVNKLSLKDLILFKLHLENQMNKEKSKFQYFTGEKFNFDMFADEEITLKLE